LLVAQESWCLKTWASEMVIWLALWYAL
jgi:hypothetical protein